MVMKSQQAHRRHRMFLTAGTALRFPRQERIAFNCSIRKAMAVGGGVRVVGHSLVTFVH